MFPQISFAWSFLAMSGDFIEGADGTNPRSEPESFYGAHSLPQNSPPKSKE
jgi:hypothetical protein